MFIFSFYTFYCEIDEKGYKYRFLYWIPKMLQNVHISTLTKTGWIMNMMNEHWDYEILLLSKVSYSSERVIGAQQFMVTDSSFILSTFSIPFLVLKLQPRGLQASTTHYATLPFVYCHHCRLYFKNMERLTMVGSFSNCNVLDKVDSCSASNSYLTLQLFKSLDISTMD